MNRHSTIFRANRSEQARGGPVPRLTIKDVAYYETAAFPFPTLFRVPWLWVLIEWYIARKVCRKWRRMSKSLLMAYQLKCQNDHAASAAHWN